MHGRGGAIDQLDGGYTTLRVVSDDSGVHVTVTVAPKASSS
jgi:hypothetical protein